MSKAKAIVELEGSLGIPMISGPSTPVHILSRSWRRTIVLMRRLAASVSMLAISLAKAAVRISAMEEVEEAGETSFEVFALVEVDILEMLTVLPRLCFVVAVEELVRVEKIWKVLRWKECDKCRKQDKSRMDERG